MSLQRPYSKKSAQPHLLLSGHMQSPDRYDWDNQNHEIAHNIDDACADKDGILVKALFSPCNSVGFADAFGRDREDKSKRIEEIPVEDEPDARI